MIHSQPVSDVKQLAESLGQLPEPAVEPVFIIVGGLPGTGKSYFSRKLAERLPFLILESDALRKILFPEPTYSQQESWHLFRTLYLLIERLLKRGIPIILDATNLSERHRERLYNIADGLGSKLVLVWVEAPPEAVRQRLDARKQGSDRDNRSDADWEVYQKMRPTVQRIRRNHFTVDTSRDITPVLDKIVRQARR